MLFREGKLRQETATSSLSLNRFSTSFLAFFAMFLYGLTLEHFNHYLVWPRTLALVLILGILYEIQHDNGDKLSRTIFRMGVIAVVLSFVLAFTKYRIVVHSTGLSQILVMGVTLLFVQGALHQILKIRRCGSVGGLSLGMHQLFLLKDLSTLIFGFSLGLSLGWPVILLHGMSLIMMSVTIWHFRFVRLSPVAIEKSIF